MESRVAPVDARIFTWVAGAVGPGIGVAIKDNIDQAGVVSSAGSRARSRHATPATSDAACLAGLTVAIQHSRAHIVGRTTMDEFAAGATGINPWTGVPPNPVDERLIPGGSSSGSAVAVARGWCDVAYGTDTGGSVRIPAACCGVAGLKTTRGRVSLQGVHPLSQTLDTVGVIARNVADLGAGMELLEPTFRPIHLPGTVRLGRVRLRISDSDLEEAIDRALILSELPTVDVELPSWPDCHGAAFTILMAEAWANNAETIARWPHEVGEQRRIEIESGAMISQAEVMAARIFQRGWEAEVLNSLKETDVLCLPTIGTEPPLIEDVDSIDWSRFSLTMPFNLAGVPALALPLILPARHPASLQLVSRHGGEPLLLAVAARIEATWEQAGTR